MRGFKTLIALSTAGTNKLLKITHCRPSPLVGLVTPGRERGAGCCSARVGGRLSRELPEARGGCQQRCPPGGFAVPTDFISPLGTLETQPLVLSLPRLHDWLVAARRVQDKGGHTQQPSVPAPSTVQPSCHRPRGEPHQWL